MKYNFMLTAHGRQFGHLVFLMVTILSFNLFLTSSHPSIGAAGSDPAKSTCPVKYEAGCLRIYQKKWTVSGNLSRTFADF
jgi:hypothetical protein